METETEMQTEIQVLLLRNDKYVIAEIEQLDEEPSCYLTNCFEIQEEFFYDSETRTPHIPPENGVLISKKEYEDEFVKDDGTVKLNKGADFTYVVLTRFPKHSKSNDCLMHSNELVTMCDPQDEILELYKKMVN